MSRPSIAAISSISAVASLALITGCPGDDGPSVVDTESSTGTSTTSPVTITITDPTMPAESSSSESSSSGSSSEGTTVVLDGTSTTDASTTSGSSTTETTTGEPPALWMADFASELVLDPEDDDYGPGSYVYPKGVDDASSDLRSFEMSYTAADGLMHFTIGLTSIGDNTRIGMMLLDEAAWANAGADSVFTVGGVEVRSPNWNATGVQMILMDPASPLFDFGAINDIDPFSDNPRPDNAIYLDEANGAPFLGADGLPSYVTGNLQRLDVTVDTAASPATMSFDVDANWLTSYLDTESPNLYVAVWAYTLIDVPMPDWYMIEFGSLEVTEALGGLSNTAPDNWRDCDAYDVMFFDGAYTQESFLDVPVMPMGDPVSSVVVFETVGEGVLQIPTGA